MNRVLIRPILKKTPYELFNGRKPNINHLISCSCFVLNNGKENLGKFDEKANHVDHKSIQISKNSVEGDEQNISLEKLDICAEKQPVDCSK